MTDSLPGKSSARPRRARGPLTFAARSIAGEKRSGPNEDAIVSDQRRGLAAVFDGVGGSVHGAKAAQVAARSIRRGWKAILRERQQEPGLLEIKDGDDLCALLQRLVEEAHEAIRADIRRRGARIARERGAEPQEALPEETQATTIALAVVYRQRAEGGYGLAYAYVGDSRIYLLHEGQPLQRLSFDDGYLKKLVQKGELSEADALRIDQATEAAQLSELEMSYFEKRNGITQALGDRRPPEVRTGQAKLSDGDRVLLCSDGIHDNLIDREIEETLRQSPRTTAARLLIERALQRSHEDEEQSLRAKSDDMSALVITCHF